MVIYEVIALTHKNLKPNPTSPDRQLSLTINRLAAGCTYSTLSDFFGVSVSAASTFFDKICWLILFPIMIIMFIYQQLMKNGKVLYI